MRFIVTLSLLTALVTSCSISQYIPAGEYLYDGASVEIIAADSVPTGALAPALSATLNNNGNAKTPVLGYYQLWRRFRYEERIAEDTSKIKDEPPGDEPVYYDDNVVESTLALLENRAYNNGYFGPEATFETDTSTNPPEITVRYDVAVTAPYHLDSTAFFIRDSSVAAIIGSTQPKTLLKPGVRYDLDRLRNERQRWEDALREAGYFYARAADYEFLADTVSGDREVDLLAKIKDDIPPNHLEPQRIRRINVYPNYDESDTLRNRNYRVQQTGGLSIYCDDCPLRPEILDEAFAMKAGDLYSPERHRKTLRRLANYNTFRYISLDYDGRSDSGLVLNAYMEPVLKRRFEGEFGLTYNSAGYVGPNVAITYLNRNLLGGAELLTVTGDLSYATFSGSEEQARVPRSGIYGLTATLNVPRLWVPRRSHLIPRVITSGTVISLGAKLERLSLNLGFFESGIRSNRFATLAERLEEDPSARESISLLQLRARYGYTWSRRITKSHLLNPIAIRFQDPVVSTEEVLDLARDQGLAPGGNAVGGASRFDRMLVYSPGYTMTFDSRLRELRTHNFFWQQYVSMNWNNVFPVGTAGLSEGRITSLYPQLETDFRYYLTIAQGVQVATRVHGGIAFPLSDRAIVPYFDLYTIGGPNSLRGFAPRQLGPGRTVPVQNNLISFGGFGNLLFETSVEFRYRVNSLIELAPFFDAGNVWTYKTELEPLETDFRRTEFVNELAMNYGLGFRFDLQFLILRIDLAKPFQIPYEEAFENIMIPERLPGDPPEDGIRLNVAFGYPF